MSAGKKPNLHSLLVQLATAVMVDSPDWDFFVWGRKMNAEELASALLGLAEVV